jgi:pimeloyl-ACP methyl ester carboxylesterase
VVKNIGFAFAISFVFGISTLAQRVQPEFGNNPQAGNYAPVNGIRLYYETYGKGVPLLLLHGNGGSIADMRFQIPFFEKYYRVIAIDSRLQGKSGGSPDTVSYELMASDFCALLDYLHLDSAYVLGWSDGGINGLIMAMNCPGKIKKLAFTGANVVPDSSAFRYKDILDMQNFEAQNPAASKTEKALIKMMVDQPHIPYSSLHNIRCPVLVMAGDQDIIKAEHTLKIFQSIPCACLSIFPDSRHGVCQQHPQLFNETVLTFFRK